MNDCDNYIHKHYVLILSSKKHEGDSSGSENDSAKINFFPHKDIIFDLLLKKSKII